MLTKRSVKNEERAVQLYKLSSLHARFS